MEQGAHMGQFPHSFLELFVGEAGFRQAGALWGAGFEKV